MEGGMEGGRGGWSEGGVDGGREGGMDGGREGWMEGWREGGRGGGMSLGENSTVSQAVDSRHQVFAAGGAVVTDVLPLALVTVVHGLTQAIGQGPSKLRERGGREREREG